MIAEAVRWASLMLKNNRHYGGCSICGEHHYGPVVQDSVWLQIKPDSPRHYILCLSCMETQLGRKIEEKDLKPVPWNEYRKAFFERRIK